MADLKNYGVLQKKERVRRIETGSAIVICPKCGFDQDERIDCLRCGVIFSKYFAVHPEARPVRAESADAPADSAQHPHEHSAPPEQSHVEQPAPDRQAQEPEQTSSETSGLDRRIHSTLKVYGERLWELQKRIEERPKLAGIEEKLAALRGEIRQEIEALREVVRGHDPRPLLEQLHQVESRLEALPSELAGQIEAGLSQRVSGVETRFSGLEEALKNGTAQPSQREDSEAILELGNVLKELDGLRAALQNVTVRYSEIGELKKNYLSFANTLESLHREVAAGKEGGYAESLKKTAELEREVAALRAETRQMLQQAESSGGPSLAAAGEIQELKERVQGLVQDRSHQDKRLGEIENQIGAPTIDSKTDPKVLVKIQEIEARFAELEQKLEPSPNQSGKRKMADPLLELGKLLKEVDGLRTSLQNVTVRYSEIAELKKNHLSLSHFMESQARELAALKEAVSGSGLKRFDDAQIENEALRTECKQLAKRVEEVDAAASMRLAQLEEKQARRDAEPKIPAGLTVLSQIQQVGARLSELQSEVACDGEHTAREAAELRTRLDNTVAGLEDMQNSLQRVTARSADIGELKKNHHLLAEKLHDLGAQAESIEGRLATLLAQPLPEPLPPLEADVHAIRDNLDQIRHFMSTLAQKL